MSNHLRKLNYFLGLFSLEEIKNFLLLLFCSAGYRYVFKKVIFTLRESIEFLFQKNNKSIVFLNNRDRLCIT